MTVQSKVLLAESRPLNSIGDAGEDSDAIFDLSDFLRILRIRKRIIIGTSIAIVALTAVAVFQTTPRYTASAVVMLEQRENRVADVQAVLSGLPTDPTSIENQVQILRSRTLLSRVADKLRLDADPEFNPALTVPGFDLLAMLNPRNWFGGAVSTLSEESRAAAVRNSIIDRLQGRLNVASQGRSTAIRIGFQSPAPAKAAMVANAIADAYVEDQLNAKFEATQAATKWLAERIQELSSQVQAAESAVQQYKAENDLTETADGTSLVVQQLGDLNAQLVIVKSALAEQEAKYARVTELQRSGRSADVSQVVASPLISQLRGQEAELMREEAELSSRYGPRHPRMVDIASQRRNLESKIAEEVRRVVETVSSDVAIARARVRSLEGSLNQMSAQTASQSQARVKLRELEASATSSRSLYEAFLSRFKETQGQQDIQTPDARVISRAEIPTAASFPNVKLTLGAAVPGSLFLGFLLAMLAEKLDSGFRTTAQLERALGMPVLATLPEISGLPRKGKSAADRVIDKPMSSFSEAVRGLQLGLTLSNVDKRPKVILVTSSVPGEGKTTVAINLARMAARNGQKVIVLDGDLRRPSVAGALGVGARKMGLIEAITGASPLEDCLVRDPRTGMVVLPAVSNAPNPPDLLGSAAMERFIAGLRTFYDMIVIDSAPLLPVNDTKVLCKLADAVLFVVRWEKTPREAVATGMRALSDIKAPVVGVAMSRADTKRYHYYSYGYGDYYAYAKYYSD